MFSILILVAFLVASISALIAWKIIQNIPEVRIFLKLDRIETDADLAERISGVNVPKHEKDQSKIGKFINPQRKDSK